MANYRSLNTGNETHAPADDAPAALTEQEVLDSLTIKGDKPGVTKLQFAANSDDIISASSSPTVTQVNTGIESPSSIYAYETQQHQQAIDVLVEEARGLDPESPRYLALKAESQKHEAAAQSLATKERQSVAAMGAQDGAAAGSTQAKLEEELEALEEIALEREERQRRKAMGLPPKK